MPNKKEINGNLLIWATMKEFIPLKMLNYLKCIIKRMIKIQNMNHSSNTRQRCG